MRESLGAPAFYGIKETEMNRTMKKITALLASGALIAAMAACSAPSGGNEAPELISGGKQAAATTAEGKEAAASSSDPFSFTYKGVSLSAGMETESAVKALGEGYVYNKIDDCAIEGGKTETYDYKDFVIFSSNRDGTPKIFSIEIRGASVDLGGVKIGSTLDDVKKALGAPTSEELWGYLYQKDGRLTQFLAPDGKTISSVLYKTEQ